MLINTALMCIAINVYQEARSEPLVGQLAVASVTMRRAGKDTERVCNVVFADKQFSWTTGLAVKTKNGWRIESRGIPKEKEAWEQSVNIAKLAVSNSLIDYSGGATHYHRKDIRPYWVKGMKRLHVADSGKHIFYRKVKS